MGYLIYKMFNLCFFI